MPVCSKLPMRRRKEKLIGCDSYSNFSLCVLFPLLACFFLLAPFPALCWRKHLCGSQQTYLGSCPHRASEEAQESAGVAFINVCLMSDLVQMHIFSEQSKSKRSCLSFFLACVVHSCGHFHTGFCCCCGCVCAIARSSML